MCRICVLVVRSAVSDSREAISDCMVLRAVSIALCWAERPGREEAV